MSDGSVETVLSGTPSNVEEMIKRLKSGPISARVDDVKELNSEEINENFDNFSVRR